MAKNEAKIKFTAETGGFNKSIKQANDTMSKLRAELKLNDTQMKNSGNSVEKLERKHSLLEDQLEASKSKTEALTQKVEKAVEIFGENSTEATKLKTQLANAQAAEEKIRQEIERCNSELEEQVRVEKEAESATGKLTSEIDEQQKEVNRLKDEYVEAVLQYGETSDEAKQLAKEISDLSSDLAENKKKMQSAESQADKFDNTLEDVNDSAGEASEGFTVAKGVLADLASAGIQKAIEGFKELGETIKESYQAYNEGEDNLIKATGAVGSAADALSESYANVAKSVLGDMDVIGAAVGEVNTRFGYTGTELEECSVQFMKFSEITGTDAVSAVQLVSRAMGDAGIDSSEYKSVLDNLAVAAQASGISVDTLTEQLTKYGAPMRALGFDTKESIAVFASWEKAGVNTEIAFSGMKKAISNWGAEGKDSREEFKKTLDEIKACPDIASATTKAIEVFGAKAGPDLADAIQAGRFEYSDFLAILEGSEGAVTNTFEEIQKAPDKVALGIQGVKTSMGEAADTMLSAFEPAITGAVVPALSKLADGIVKVGDWLSEHPVIMKTVAAVLGVVAAAITALTIVVIAYTVAQWAMNAAVLANPITWLVVGIVAAIAAIVAIIVLVIEYWDQIVAAVKTACSKIVSALKTAFGWIKDNWLGLALFLVNPLAGVFKLLYDNCDGFREKVDTVVAAVKGFFVGLWDKITTGFKAVIDWVKTNWKAIVAFLVNPLAGVFTYLYTNFDGFRDKVDSVISAIKGFFIGLWDGIKSVWNKICNVVQVAIMFIGSLISAAVNIITLPFRFIWENCKKIVFNAFEKIKTVVTAAINVVKTTVTTVFEAIKSRIQAVLNTIKGVFTTVWNAIKSAVSNVLNAIKAEITERWNAIKAVISRVVNLIKSEITKRWNAIKTAVTTVVNGIKTAVTNAWNATKTAVTNAVNATKNKAVSIWNSIKSAVSNVVTGIKNAASNGFNAVKSTAQNVWNGVKNAIMKPVNAAKDAVKTALDKIKGFFDKLKIKFPNIKLPHFSITGKFSIDPPSVPKLGIEWYSKAMSSPMILNGATIFGQSNGRLLGGGEAGSEMIGGTSTVMQMIQSAVDRSVQSMNISALAAAVEDLANRPIEIGINGRQVALATAGDSDRVNGLRNRITDRGVLLD